MQILKVLREIVSEFGFLGSVELLAAFVVACGCVGEFWILLNKLTRHIEPLPKNVALLWRILARVDGAIRPIVVRLKISGRKISEPKESLLERFCVMLVALGVAVEFVCLTFSLPEVAELKKETALANERTASMARRVEELRAANDALEDQIAPRSFDQGRLSEAIKTIPEIQVLLITTEDPEAVAFASQMHFCFGIAGWRVIVRPKWPGPWQPGVHVSAPIPSSPQYLFSRDEKAEMAAALLRKELNSKGVAVGRQVPPNDALGIPDNALPTNTIIVFVARKPEPIEARKMHDLVKLSEDLSNPVGNWVAISNDEAKLDLDEDEEMKQSFRRGLIPTNSWKEYTKFKTNHMK